MTTKKAGKKSRKKSGKKKDEREDRKKAPSPKSGSKKAAGRKIGSKKSGGKKSAAKKSTAPSKGSKKAAARDEGRTAGAREATRGVAKATGGVARDRAVTDVVVLKGNCLGLVEAGAIVEHAVVTVGGIAPGDYNVDKRLEQMGVFTPNQCVIVKQMILNDVRGFPCDIDDGDVSFDPGTVARVIRDQVKDNAAKPQ